MSLEKSNSAQTISQEEFFHTHCHPHASLFFLSVSVPLALSVSVKLVLCVSVLVCVVACPWPNCDGRVLCCSPAYRAGLGVHRVPQSRLDDARGAGLGRTVLLHAADARAGQSG